MRSTELRQFIEDFALVLTDAGMQRMGARAFGALLSSESGTLTAREIAGVLDVSPAAVSGAVKYLEQAQLVRRMRRAGERVDRYTLGDDTWYTAVATRTQIFESLNRALSVGIEALPDSSLAAERLAETRDFFDYIKTEMPLLVERWRASCTGH